MRRHPATISSLMLILLLSGAALAEELTIGLIPEQNVFLQKKRYEPIAAYLRERADLTVRFTILSNYGDIFESFADEKMDGAFWGSFTAALAIEKIGIELVARPVWLDGSSTYHGHVFVRKDGGIRTVADMRGKTIAFVAKATLAGYVFPMAYLRENGVSDIESYFEEYYFAGSHDGPIYSVLQKEADIGCAKDTIFNLVADRNPRVRSELVILAESPAVPSNALGVRGDLDPVIVDKLRETLLSMDEDPAGRKVLAEFGARAFIATTKQDYAVVTEIAERAGIDLKSYVYTSE